MIFPDPASLIAVREDLSRGVLKVGVFGAFSAGKSTFLNAFLGEELLTVATEPTTALPTEVVYGGAFNVQVLDQHGQEISRLYPEGQVPTWARLIGGGLLEHLRSEGEGIRTFVRTWTAEGGRAVEGGYVRIQWPQAFLRQKLVLVDTPGTDVEIARHGKLTLQVASEVDVAICILDSRQGLTRTSMEFILDLAPRVGRIFVILTKIDCVDLEERDEKVEETQAFLIQEWPKGATSFGKVLACSAQSVFDAALAKKHPILATDFSRFKADLLEDMGRERGRLILRRNGDSHFLLASQAKHAGIKGDLHAEHEGLRAAFDLAEDAGVIPPEWMQEALAACEQRLTSHAETAINAQHLLDQIRLLLDSPNTTQSECRRFLEEVDRLLDEVNQKSDAFLALVVEAMTRFPDLTLPKLWDEGAQPDSFTWVKNLSLIATQMSKLVHSPFEMDPSVLDLIQEDIRHATEIGVRLGVASAWVLKGQITWIDARRHEGAQLEQALSSASRFFSFAAKAGDPIGQVYALLCETCGWGKQPIPNPDRLALTKAAGLGFPEAQFQLSRLEILANAMDGMKLAEQAAEAGHSQAQFFLGEHHIKKEGGAYDLARAMEWLSKSANQGNVDAQNLLGINLILEKPMAEDPQNRAKGMEWIRRAAHRNYPLAQFNLGYLLWESESPENQIEAVDWFIKAAQLGNSDAQHALGICYWVGKGVSQDEIVALEWFRKAAESGHSKAQFHLGECYLNGDGIKKDPKVAFAWLKKSADQNHPEALFYVGNCIDQGIGTQRDSTDAAAYYERASHLGHPLAMHHLGLAYATGKGKKKDLKWARNWLRRANENGHSPSAELLAILEDEKGACFISTATSLALEWPDSGTDLNELRTFRDTYMMGNPERSAEIHRYYQLAPAIVAVIRSKPDQMEIWNALAKASILPALAAIRTGQLEAAHEIYRTMVLELETKFILGASYVEPKR